MQPLVTAGRSRRGSAMVEFAVVCFLLVLVLLATVEFSRMVLVANAVANSARAGVRYAVTHGSDRIGTGSTGPSGPGNDPAQVITVAKNFAAAAPVDPAKLTVNVTYPDASNAAGSRVDVKVVYAYDPFTVLPLSVNLGSTSEGVITY
jgi:Flp pilus assembly protein TadG